MTDKKKPAELNQDELDKVTGGTGRDGYANQEVSHLKGEDQILSSGHSTGVRKADGEKIISGDAGKGEI